MIFDVLYINCGRDPTTAKLQVREPRSRAVWADREEFGRGKASCSLCGTIKTVICRGGA